MDRKPHRALTALGTEPVPVKSSSTLILSPDCSGAENSGSQKLEAGLAELKALLAPDKA